LFRLRPPGKALSQGKQPRRWVMGIVLFLLGLATAGAVADFAIENGLATAPDQAFRVFGQTAHLSTTELTVAGAILGAATVILIVLGAALLGHWVGRRREEQAERQEHVQRLKTITAQSSLLQSQNAVLVEENTALRRRAEELEQAAARDVEGSGFGPPSRQVAETALITPPPPPEPPVREPARDDEALADSWAWSTGR